MESTEPGRIFKLSDFEQAFACQAPAIKDLTEGQMRKDVAKLLKEEHKIDVEKIDWRKWHNLLSAYAFAVKEGFLAEAQKICSEKASQQMLFLANLYKRNEEEEQKKKTIKKEGK